MNETTITETILSTNMYLTLSTVNQDGSPWGTPVHFAYSDKNMYWFSFDNAIHSVNLARDPRVFITIFSPRQNPAVAEERAALYVATTARKLEGDEERLAQDIFSDRIEDDRHLGEDAHFYTAALGTLDEAKSSSQRLYYSNDKSS